MLDFIEETEKRKKKIQTNSPVSICILQIFGNNPSRGFRVKAETKCGGGAGGGGGGGRIYFIKNNTSPPPHSGWRLNKTVCCMIN